MQDPPSGAQGSRVLIVFGLLMAVSLAALDTSIVVPAMPVIVGSLGGLDLYSWVFSVYLLTSTVSVPVYGKLADLYGRKPVILFGVTLFLIGSLLCGVAPSMETLILFRAIQGLGAGAVLPITITIVGDLFSVEQRAKLQGAFSAVWGVTGIAGPIIGGLLTDHLSWHWVFLVNLPFGFLSMFLIWHHYHEHLERREHKLDFAGAFLLTASVVLLLVALLQAGEAYGWTSIQTIGLFATSGLLLLAFVRTELAAAEPVVPPSLFRNRVIVVSGIGVFVAGGLMFGVTAYIPLFEQGVFGGSATRAGLIMAPMSVTWVMGSVVSGRTLVRFGFFPAAISGSLCLLAGASVLLLLTDDTTILLAALSGAIIGIGMGLITNATTIAVQTAVDWSQRGIATAMTQFFRTMGASIGVAIMGAFLNSRMSDRLANVEGVPPGSTADLLLDRVQREELPAPVLEAMRHALAVSLHDMFFIVFGAALLCVLAMSQFPRVRPPTASSQAAAQHAAYPSAKQAE